MARSCYPRIALFSLFSGLAFIPVLAGKGEPAEELLVASLSMYGDLKSVRLEGYIDAGKREQPVAYVDYSHVNDTAFIDFNGGTPPPKNDAATSSSKKFGISGSFKFLYTEWGDLYLNTAKFRLSRDKTGPLKFSNRGDSGVFLADTISELMEYDSEAGSLLLAFLDVVESEKQFRLLERAPSRGKVLVINGVRHVGVDLDSSRERSLWIDPRSKSIGRIEYDANEKARNREIQFLERKLKSLVSEETEQRARILKNIEMLNTLELKNERYVITIDKQEFDEHLHLAGPDPNRLRNLGLMREDHRGLNSLLEKENVHLKEKLAREGGS